MTAHKKTKLKLAFHLNNIVFQLKTSKKKQYKEWAAGFRRQQLAPRLREINIENKILQT